MWLYVHPAFLCWEKNVNQTHYRAEIESNWSLPQKICCGYPSGCVEIRDEDTAQQRISFFEGFTFFSVSDMWFVRFYNVITFVSSLFSSGCGVSEPFIDDWSHRSTRNGGFLCFFFNLKQGRVPSRPLWDQVCTSNRVVLLDNLQVLLSYKLLDNVKILTKKWKITEQWLLSSSNELSPPLTEN